MEILDFDPHTIILMIGPSGCGKTTFIESILIPSLKSLPHKIPNIQYISSDNIRKEILGQEFHKYDDQMLYASQEAFKLLYQKIDAVTTYPISAEFVIIDTKGIDKSFRENILKIAEKNNYKVNVIVFCYRKRDDYFLYNSDLPISFKKSIDKDIKKVNTEVLKDLSPKKYFNIYKIRSNNFSNIQITCNQWKNYCSYFINSNKEYVIVGDLHGCLDEFKQLLIKCNFIIDNNNKIIGDKKIILVGDIVDKGNQILELIDFIYKNKDIILVVKGNHDNRLYNEIKGLLKHLDNNKYFDTFNKIKNNEIIKNMFIDIYENSKEFYKHNNFIVTHVPCQGKYLGKIDNYSLKMQRSFIYPKREDYHIDQDYEETLQNKLIFMKEEATKNYPYHIFGHIPIKEILKYKNKIGIDTGCVLGNKLSCVSIVANPIRLYYHDVQSSYKTEDYLFSLNFNKGETDIILDTLEPKELTRVKWLAKDRINFISGTMSPSEADKDNNELESLKLALDYYKNHNINKVVLQHKYMGSRCNVYLFKDTEKSYSVSRNGYKIRENIDLSSVYRTLRIKLDCMFMDSADIIIIDGELLPWCLLGRKLIEDSFKLVGSAAQNEINFLKESRFENKLDLIRKEYRDNNYAIDSNNFSKKELLNKYNYSKLSTYNNLKLYLPHHQSLDAHQKALDVYHKQLELYGSEGETIYKPFALLKIINKDGTEKLFFNQSNYEMFKILNDDPCLLVDFNDVDYFEKVQEFFINATTEKLMEGIVVKPEIAYNKGVAPFLKVRNKNYLTITYGYDYQFDKKFKHLIDSKDIRRKLKISIDEYEVGKRMLEIPYNKIDINNNEYINLAARMVLEQKRELELDPRL